MSRIVVALLLAFAGLLGTALAASAHGEDSQEGFLRMETVAFSNVQFSTDTVKQGEMVTVTGQATILDTWPKTLGEPTTGYINVTTQGPVLLMQDRLVNGVEAPDSIFIKKGDAYEFKMTLVGRQPGSWHVHPTFAVEGAGTLIGPGHWITVQDTGGFANNLTLLNGQNVNLETYGIGQLTIFHWLGFAIGLVWMLYWTVPRIGGANHRTVSKLPVTLRVPLNTDGQDVGLITKQDHRASNWMLAATIALLGIGWVYQAVAFPIKIPQQVFRFEPPALSQPASFSTVLAKDASYDPSTSTVTMTVDVTNTGKTPATVTGFTTSSLTFVNQTTATAGSPYVMTVSPPTPIAPGQMQTVTLALRDPVWRDARILDVNRPRLEIAGQVLLQDASGTKNANTILSSLTPKFT